MGGSERKTWGAGVPGHGDFLLPAALSPPDARLKSPRGAQGSPSHFHERGPNSSHPTPSENNKEKWNVCCLHDECGPWTGRNPPALQGGEDPGAPAGAKASALGASLPPPAAHAPHTHTPRPGEAEQSDRSPFQQAQSGGFSQAPTPSFHTAGRRYLHDGPGTTVLVQEQPAAVP